MLISTTEAIEGNNIVKYLGIVAGEAVMGENVVKDMSPLGNIVSGRVAFQRQLIEARELAFKEMIEEAKKLGGNAIIGVDLDYGAIGESMIMVSANGTAVVLESTKKKSARKST